MRRGAAQLARHGFPAHLKDRAPTVAATTWTNGVNRRVAYPGNAMAESASLLVTVYGPDRPGIASRLFDRLAGLESRILDVEQIQVHERLLLCVELSDVGDRAIRGAPE